MNTKNIKIFWLFKKLDYKNIGLYIIEKFIVSILYKLRLPNGMEWVYIIFHSNFIRWYIDDLLLG